MRDECACNRELRVTIALMPKRVPAVKSAESFQKRLINRAILVVGIVQPLGTIPQIISVYGRRNASSISISSWLLFVLFDLMWLWYGIDNKQKAVAISGALFAVLEGAVLVGALLYGGSW